MSVNPYCTRSTQGSSKQSINCAAAQSGNKQVASLIEENKQQSSWKGLAFKVATIASLALLAGSMIYECYQLHKSTEERYSLNMEFGKQFISNKVSGYIDQIANQDPSLQCRIGSQLIDWVSCYAQGMTEFARQD
jgi:hypothetical protein